MSVYKKKRKDGTSAWFFDFTYKGRRYRELGGATRTQALRIQERVRNQVISGEYKLDVQGNNTKIENFAETYLKRRQHLWSSKRDNLSVRTLLSYFKGKTLNTITSADVEDYLARRLKDGVANGTINRELSCLKRMFNLAIKWKEAKGNPVNDVDFLKEPPGRTRFLYEEEAQTLIEAASPHLKPIIITALNTGMRRGEILSLMWNQVFIDEAIDPYLEIRKAKNNKRRIIPLNNDMIELLQSIGKGDDEFVFHGKYGKPLKGIKEPWQNALKKTGILDFRFHDLRHTFASHFIMKGGDVLTLKDVLGHSSMKMVERYAHLATAFKRRQINLLNGSFSIRHPNATSKKVLDSKKIKLI